MLSFSFGDLYPRRLSEGSLAKPANGTAPASRLPKKKYLLETDFISDLAPSKSYSSRFSGTVGTYNQRRR
jgi:hypothetical protein